MKTRIIIQLGVFLLTFAAITSCEYKEIADADFPEGVIYLPAAAADDGGIYLINEWPAGSTAITQGNVYRFQVNVDANEFNIPLSVYRSGLSKKSSFPVNIKTDNNTIETLKSDGTLDSEVEILPEGKYTLPASVQMNADKEVAPFILKVDLGYLTANAADEKIYALAVNISSNNCAANPELSTVVILIYSEILQISSD